jgi:hypothetical protein
VILSVYWSSVMMKNPWKLDSICTRKTPPSHVSPHTSKWSEIKFFVIFIYEKSMKCLPVHFFWTKTTAEPTRCEEKSSASCFCRIAQNLTWNNLVSSPNTSWSYLNLQRMIRKLFFIYTNGRKNIYKICCKILELNDEYKICEEFN